MLGLVLTAIFLTGCSELDLSTTYDTNASGISGRSIKERYLEAKLDDLAGKQVFFKREGSDGKPRSLHFSCQPLVLPNGEPDGRVVFDVNTITMGYFHNQHSCFDELDNDGDGLCSQRTAKQQGKCEQQLGCWLHGGSIGPLRYITNAWPCLSAPA